MYISFPFHCKTLSPCLLHISSLRIRGRSRFSQKPGILCAIPFLYSFLFWSFPCTHLVSSTFLFILLHFSSLILKLRLSPIFSPKSFDFGCSHFRYHPFSWINIQNFTFISSFHHFFQKTFVMRLTSSRNSLWRRVNNKSKVSVSKNERMKAFQCKLKRSEVESTSFVFHQIRGRIFAQSLKRICTLRPPTHLARSEQQRSIEDI